MHVRLDCVSDQRKLQTTLNTVIYWIFIYWKKSESDFFSVLACINKLSRTGGDVCLYIWFDSEKYEKCEIIF